MKLALVVIGGACVILGPYVAGGVVRTDQLAVYGLAAIFGPLIVWRIRLSRAQAVIVTAWLLLMFVSVIDWLGGGSNSSPWPAGSAPANADNLLLPIAAFVLAAAAATRDARQAREVVAALVTSVAAINAAVALGHYLVPGVVYPYLSQFWGSGGTGERALSLGRYTGVLGQPSVAGALYSLGVVCAIYAARRRPTVRFVLVGLIVVGGVLTVSKAFLLVGVPVAAWQLYRSSRGKAGQRIAILGFSAGAYLAATSLGMFAQWSGIEKLLQLLPGGQDSGFVSYTGNRYGQGASTQPIIDAVLRDHPFSGYGLAGLEIYTDTAYVQALVLAGVLGVVCLAGVAVAPLVAYKARRTDLEQSERLLLGGVAVVLAVSSLGLPVYTSNRLSLLVWALLAVLLAPTPRTAVRPSATGEVHGTRGSPVAKRSTAVEGSAFPK